MRWSGRRGMARLIAALLLGCALLAGCTSTAPPPPVVHPSAVPTTQKPVDTTQVVVGVNTVAGGYNPHTLADQSSITTALAALLLPSPFRPAADGTPQLNPTLMISAEVTSAAPYTVTYTLRRDASWSDTAPIAAEDFVYLWQQMRSQPGVVNAAGYQLISDVSARDGGKVVVVTFTKPYPGWRWLFSDLLPAHLLKDAPGGWANALSDNFPATGGPFEIKSLDRDRGEIDLERNDRWWDRPATLDQIILRKADDPGMVTALRSGDDQVALLQADSVARTTLAGLGNTVRLATVPRPNLVELLLRPASPVLADERVRGAVAAAIDRDSLIAVGTGSGPSVELRADAHVVPPSVPGYAPTIPPGTPAKPDPATVDRLLTQAGYTKVAGAWTRDGHPLSLVIAAPADHQPFVDIANAVQRQLAGAGIDARVVTPRADQLYGEVQAVTSAASSTGPQSTVDIAVVPQPVGGDPATVLASQFGCRPAVPSGTTPVPANLAGFCDSEIQPTIEAALTGGMSLSDALAAVEPALWQQSVAIPLFQLADQLAVRPEVAGAEAGPAFIGPFGNASSWRRIAH